MKQYLLSAIALTLATTDAQAQVAAGQGVPPAAQGRWALQPASCRNGEIGQGMIEVDANGYVSDGERNAAIVNLISVRGSRRTYRVIFSAVADRQWPGIMTMRTLPGGQLGITNARNAERLYVRCR